MIRTDDVVVGVHDEEQRHEAHMTPINGRPKHDRPACGGYQQGEEVPFPSLLFFALDQTKGSTYPGKRLLVGSRRSTNSA